MQVIGSDGGMVGVVDDVEGSSIKLKRAAEAGGGEHHFIPLDWVDHVDEHVHLAVDAATVRDRWTAGAYGAAPAAASAAGPAAAERKSNWIPWLIGLAVLALLLFFGLKGCDDTATEPAYDDNQSAAADPAAIDNAVATAPLPLGQAAAFIAGGSAVPATFVFEKLNFDTSSAEVRNADKDEIAELASLLKDRPAATIRLIGFADARGSDPANATLGQRRADAVKAALVSSGIEAGRIETASGGENDPAATNATANGQFENRRTEVEILTR
jgi:outer membrane protein OmpA-like peptidoglycan-associated protein